MPTPLPCIMQRLRDAKAPANIIQKAGVADSKAQETLKRAIAKNARIAFGSDAAVCPHGSQVNQFAIFVKAGMKPLAAIRTATSVDAALLGVSDRGTLETGKLADLVAVPGDPSGEISVMEKLFFVMKGGSVVRNDRTGAASAGTGASGTGNSARCTRCPAAARRSPLPVERAPPIEVAREVCTDYPRSSRLEWLLTNATGGFAMGTVAGANTRRYHGLLVASLHPPVARVVTLARLEETALTPQGAVALSVNQYPDTLYPDGHTRLVRFSLEEGPVWTWAVSGVEVERRVLLVPGQQTVLVRYASAGPMLLRIEPLLAFRDYHALSHRNPAAWTVFEERASERPGGALPAVSEPPLAPPRSPWRPVRRRADVAREPRVPRGARPRPRLPGGPPPPRQLRARARPRNAAARGRHGRGRSDTLDPRRARLAVFPGLPARPFAGADASGDGIGEPRRGANPAGAGLRCLPRAPGGRLGHGHRRLPVVHRLGPGHDDFPPRAAPRARTPGPRARGAGGLLAHLEDGLVPNRFPDAGGPAEYNTADATLLMFQAVNAWEQAGGSPAFVRDVFYPSACAIVDAHLRGTRNGIHVDPGDRLLVAGGPEAT